jgi:glycine/D-amino acid oxidase-like deaminating enzyme
MVEAAGDSCEVKLNTRIVDLVVAEAQETEKIQAFTEDGEAVIANNCIIAAGAWTNEVLDMAGLPKLDLKIWQVQWAHYFVEDPDVAASIPQAFFFRNTEESDIDGGLYYIFPASATECKDDGCAYVKVGVDFRTGDDLESMDSFDAKGSEVVLQLMDEWVQEHLPGVGKRVDSYTSPYTMTDDSYFVMDNICDGVTVFSGGSGRAFKFAPLLGDCLAALAVGDESPVDLTRFACDRKGLKLPSAALSMSST